jgi:hypothetical protein
LVYIGGKPDPEDLPMRDLINALKTIEESTLPSNRGIYLDASSTFKEKVPGSAVLLGRIDELAFETLVFSSGRLEGEPDHYNMSLMKDAGFDISIRGSVHDGNLEGEIVTSKGRIRFG